MNVALLAPLQTLSATRLPKASGLTRCYSLISSILSLEAQTKTSGYRQLKVGPLVAHHDKMASLADV
jgi:hypothetical protein